MRYSLSFILATIFVGCGMLTACDIKLPDEDITPARIAVAENLCKDHSGLVKMTVAPSRKPRVSIGVYCKDGNWINGAAHALCNAWKGSRYIDFNRSFR